MAARLRWLRYLLRAGVAVAVLGAMLLAGGYAWLGSRHALDWFAQQAVHMSGGRLALDGVEGSLLDEVRVGRLVYADESQSLEAEMVALRWQPYSALLGELRVRHISAVQVRYRETTPAPLADPPAHIGLPLRVSVSEATIARMAWNTAPAIENLRLRYSGGPRVHRVALAHLSVSEWSLAGDVEVAAKPPFATKGNFEARGSYLGKPVTATAALQGSLEALEANISGQAQGAMLHASSRLRPLTPNLLEALQVRVDKLDLAAWDKALPRTSLALEANAKAVAPGELEGSLHAVNAAPGRIDASHLPLTELRLAFRGGAQHWILPELKMRLPKTGQVRGAGTLRDGVASFELDLKGVDPAHLHGRAQSVPVSGRATISGNRAGLQVKAALEGAGIKLQVSARHADRIITVDAARLRAQDGSLDFSGRLALDDARAFAVQGKFAQLDPSRFVQAPPARLNGTLAAAGSLAPAWRVEADLALVASELRGLPLAARAKFESNAGRPFAGEARVAIGRNRLDVAGAYGRADDQLQWRLDAADLHAIDKDYSGSVAAKGSFAGTVAAPRVAFSASARKLAARGYSAASLKAEGQYAAGPDEPLRIEATAAGLRAPQGRLDVLKVTGSGTRRHHGLKASLQGHGVQASLAATGGVDTQWRWQGTLDELEAGGKWPLKLTAPARLAFGPGLIAVEHFQVQALAGELGPASLRVENGRIDTAGAFRGIAAGTLLALAERSPLDARDLRLGGDWNLALTDTANGSATVRRESGDLAISTGERLAFGLSRLELKASVTDNALDAHLEADGKIMGRAAVQLQTRIARRNGQWMAPADAPLAGSIAFDMPSIAWVRAWTPDVDAVGGRVAAKTTIAGTIGKPRLAGHVTADDLSVRALDRGLALGQGRLRAQFQDNILILKEFFISAGAGSITAEGKADLDRGLRSLDFTARADRARIFDSPQLALVMSGKGSAGLRDGRLALAGRFSVDEGRYDLGTERRPALGDDVIIRTPDAAGRKQPAPMPVQLDVGVDLNDRFTVRGYGLDALLGGSLQITTRGDALAAAGTVRTVRGEYAAFGQTLTIERGALLFSGPLGNPGLDLRAIRKIQAVEVGIEASGSLQRPVVKLISTPDMPDSDRLAWLALGRDPQSVNRAEIALLQAAALGLAGRGGTPLQRQLADGLGLDELGFSQGEDGALGVLALGKRITSRLTVRLEQSLGGTAGSLVRIDYLISERWRLRGTTGAENAGDVLFTLRFD